MPAETAASGWTRDDLRRPGSGVDGHQVIAIDGSTLIWLRIVVEATNARFFAVVMRRNSSPIVLAEEEIRHPGPRWEIRCSGLWADHNCEDPLVHWSYGLEAFALALDDPSQLVREGVGDRVPIGWELDFEATQDPSQITNGYAQKGRLHGLLLTAEGESPFVGSAMRQHWWGHNVSTPEEISIDGAWAPSDVRTTDSLTVEIPVGQDVWVGELSPSRASVSLRR